MTNPFDKTFWHALIYDLPEGISIVPTAKGWIAYIVWTIFQAVMEMALPVSKTVNGVVLKNGRSLPYPMNGTASFVLSHMVCYALAYCGIIEPQFVWRNMGSLVSVSLIAVFFESTWMYIDFGLLWRRHAHDPDTLPLRSSGRVDLKTESVRTMATFEAMDLERDRGELLPRRVPGPS